MLAAALGFGMACESAVHDWWPDGGKTTYRRDDAMDRVSVRHRQTCYLLTLESRFKVAKTLVGDNKLVTRV